MNSVITRLCRDRFALGLTSAAALALGLIVLFWPVQLGDYDRWGFRVDCGSALIGDRSEVGVSHGDAYVGPCHSAVWGRRAWAALPLGVGALGMVLAFYRSERP